MNISKNEQRVLHVLAQGGLIRHLRDDNGRITEIHCVTRDGYILTSCTMDIFTRLRAKKLIESRGGSPYRIALKGRQAVRSQADNR
jgi:Uncharacterized protein conserved in bacteria